jgi:hypothetical protein
MLYWKFNYPMANAWDTHYATFAMLDENVEQFGGEVIDEYQGFSLVRRL